MKRFTATEKWSDPWFRKLSPRLKALWLYLCDACDHAGIWQADFELASFIIGEEVTMDDLNRHFEGRCVLLAKGRIFIPGFIEFQYGLELNPENSAHRGVIRALETAESGLSKKYLAPSKPLPSPCQGAQDKDKDKDKDSERNGELGKTSDSSAQAKREELKTVAVRVGSIMHRRADSKWTDPEKRSLAKCHPIPEESLAAVERYYADQWPPDREKNILRHDLATLLNNWPGEVDRALRHFGTNGHGAKSASTDPTPAEIAAWLATVPDYTPKRGEWTTWDKLPPFAREKFLQHRKTTTK